MGDKYDFGGIATKYNLRCADGLTIRKGAFKDMDGAKVPLVWNHRHDGVEHVLGHAILEDKGDHVYAYCKLNDSENGKKARAALENGDLDSLSIFANELDKRGSNVMHGVIREVSLVLAGANPGAVIDRISIAHAYGIDLVNDPDAIDEITEASIYHGITDCIDIFDNNSDVNKKNDTLSHADDDKNKEDKKEEFKVAAKEKTIQEIFDELTDEQKEVVYAIIGQAVQDAKGGADDDDDDLEQSYYGGEYLMHNNLFDNGAGMVMAPAYPTKGEVQQIFADAKSLGSLKKSLEHHMKDDDGVLAHAYPHNEDGSEQTYGIADINWLFPEARTLQAEPEFIKREQDWVSDFMNATKHVPFSRVKTVFADITEDEARAKGYQKGHKKIEEVFTLLKRKTEPTTIYKKQKLDREDIIDITDFSVVSWLMGEMRMMLNEEIARAALIGDGRLSSSDDKIPEDHIRPIYTDDELFSIHVQLTLAANATEAERAWAIIKALKKERKQYKGSGNPKLYITEDDLSEMLLLQDADGYFMFKTITELETTLRVSKIVTVPVMENITRTPSGSTDEYTLCCILVNPVDYVIGTDKGGEITSFDDFDIDYNQYKYLMETRCSGALVKPKSAIVVEIKTAA